jgi:hypothetical protein
MSEKTEVQSFTLAGFLDKVEPLKSKHGYTGSWDTKHGRESFTGGCPDYPSAIKLGREGWSEGWESIRPIVDHYLSNMTSRIERQVWEYDVTGSILDVAAFCIGEPEHWQTSEPTVAEGLGNKLIRVVCCIGARGMVDPECIRARGAAMTALVTLLEHAGHSVQVEAVSPAALNSENGTPDLEVRVMVKAFGEPLDGPRLAFALSHPAMLRRLVFAIRNNHPTMGREFSNGMGFSVNSVDRGDIYLPALTSNVTVDENWIMENLEACGVHITRQEA